jgi:hypothetical protein
LQSIPALAERVIVEIAKSKMRRSFILPPELFKKQLTRSRRYIGVNKKGHRNMSSMKIGEACKNFEQIKMPSP